MRGYLNLLILGYLPWLIVDNLINYFSPIISILIALAIIAPFAYKTAKQQDYIGLVFTSGFLAYCANLLFHQAIFALYAKSTLLIVGLVALLTVIIRKPFTITYAKVTVSSDKWKHPTFIKINMIISLVWAIIFLSEYVLKILNVPYYTTFNILLVVIGFKFSSKFPDYYLQKNKYIN